MKNKKNAFRIRLKMLREDVGYSQQSFADTFGKSQSAVGSWEAGQREPEIDTLIGIADFFGVTLDYLVGRTENKFTQQKILEGESLPVELRNTDVKLRLVRDIIDEKISPREIENVLKLHRVLEGVYRKDDTTDPDNK